MKKFKAGDVVKLPSGGPKMTVTSSGEGNAYCCWFDGNTICLHAFAEDALVKCEPEAGTQIDQPPSDTKA